MPTPVTLKIKFKSATVEEFIERYSVDVSKGGIFIRTPKPLAVGTALKFEFQLQDTTPLLSGSGTVVWVREKDADKPEIAPGMGLRFDQLPPESQRMLERVLEQKEQAAEFSDEPTRVATEDAEALAQSPEGAGFTAAPEAGAAEAAAEQAAEPAEEAATPAAEEAPAAEAATEQTAGKPAESEEERKQRLEALLFAEEEQSASDEQDEPSDPGAKPLAAPPGEEDAQASDKPTAAAPEQKSSAVMWIVILLAIGAAAVIYFKFFKKPEHKGPVTPPKPAVQAPLKPDAQVEPPKPEVKGIAVKVESTPEGAKIIVDGTDTGKVTPAELDNLTPDKEIELKLDLPGKKLHVQKLVPKEGEPIKASLDKASTRVVHLLSEPAGATVYLERKYIGMTPADFKKRIRPGKTYRFRFYKKGYKDGNQAIKGSEMQWAREGEDESATVKVELESHAAKPRPRPAPKPAPKPAVKPEPKPEPKPAVKPEPKPAVKPEPKPEPKPAAKPEPKPEPKPAAKPEPKPEPKPETKAKPKIKMPSWGD